MASYGMNDVKNGMKIIVNGEPCVITDTEYVKPGKGQAFTRIKYRFIKSGRTVELTMKATDSLEAADVVDTDMQFLYTDGEYWHFMQQETFEQVQADKAGMGGAEKWLKGEESCVVTLWNGSPIAVQPPNFVELKIVETDELEVVYFDPEEGIEAFEFLEGYRACTNADFRDPDIQLAVIDL